MMNRRNFLSLVTTLQVGFGPARTLAQQATPEPSSDWAHPEWFADPIWIQDHLADESVRIIALTPLEDFAAGHIPGASQIDWPDLALTDSAEATIATWQAVVAQQLADRSIVPGNTVVIYDGGTFYAARLW